MWPTSLFTSLRKPGFSSSPLLLMVIHQSIKTFLLIGFVLPAVPLQSSGKTVTNERERPRGHGVTASRDHVT